MDPSILQGGEGDTHQHDNQTPPLPSDCGGVGRKTPGTLQPSLSPWRRLSVALQPPLKSALLDCILMALLPGWLWLSPLYGWGNRGMRHESHLPRAPRAEVAASVGISAWSPGHSGLHQARERCSREMRSPSPSFQSVESAPTETDWPFKNRWEF